MKLIPSHEWVGAIDGVDLRDPKLYSHGDPHALWEAMRQRIPVHWQPANSTGFWSITKWDDANRVLRDHVAFTSQRGNMLSMLGLHDPAAGIEMTVTDPPRHTSMRIPLQQRLHGKALDVRGPAIRSVVRDILLAVPTHESFDMASVAMRLSVGVAGVVLGLPESDLPKLTRLAFRAVAPADPAYSTPDGEATTLVDTHRELFAYFYDLVGIRATQPGDDLISLLCQLRVEGQVLSRQAVIANCYSMLLGATVTTPQVVSATLLALIETEIYDALRADTDLVSSMVEEGLRWSSPANHFMRYATHDVRIRDASVRAGDAIVVWIGSANRDSEVFVQPHVFDIRRSPNRHIAFGVGPHHCIGHAVARLTLRTTFDEILRQFTAWSIDGPVEHLESNFIAGIRRVHLSACRPYTP